MFRFSKELLTCPPPQPLRFPLPPAVARVLASPRPGQGLWLVFYRSRPQGGALSLAPRLGWEAVDARPREA